LYTDCEHNVFAALDCANINLALHKPASQPSTYSNAVATRAVDGSDDTVSCTLGLMHPWWSVDLEAPYDISHVTVTNDRNAPAGNHRRNFVSTTCRVMGFQHVTLRSTYYTALWYLLRNQKIKLVSFSI